MALECGEIMLEWDMTEDPGLSKRGQICGWWYQSGGFARRQTQVILGSKISRAIIAGGPEVVWINVPSHLPNCAALVHRRASISAQQPISSYDDWQLGRNDDFYDIPLDFTNFNWDDFEQFDTDPCSEFLNFFNDEPSSESHQDAYSISPVITDASPFVFPFESLPNVPVDDQEMGSGFSRPNDEPCYAQSHARTPALYNSAYNQTDVTSNSYPSLSANVSSRSSPQESPGKKSIKDAKQFSTICQKGCNTKAILRRHLKIHDPNLKCDFPGCSQKPFAENRDLERDRASHGIIGPLL
ncbi:uncharacterized protein EAE98_004336 [Botrytis deweyae]|uniref:C2H2-type domain-containing protein n=1 Tax=Botrytis deweyae TaxID=2478750 RepID=A0ABQ7IQK5_9HELO|nr:uncharacterized protein EAE98_004336 [Botrytis deweyae]KAF7931600.1 hypothetical protein EAE98_004336 [Botrytis deweyae]